VEDFAYRRGTRYYGTVLLLVDLEPHALARRCARAQRGDTFAHYWLSEHPGGVEVVSRDRGGQYAAEAARRAVPDGVQVADRFHLLKNLRDVIL
jgi:transposase